MLDPICVARRIEISIARMLAEYQNKGTYLDLDGRLCSDSDGIIRAWAELDSIS